MNRISTVMQSLRFTLMKCREDFVPSRPISLIGNTRRLGRGDDLSMVVSPSGLCRVCEYVVSGFRCPKCSVQPGGTSRLLYSVWNGRRSMSSPCWGEKSRPHTELPPIWGDQQFAMLKSLGMISEFQQPRRLRPEWGWDAVHSEECQASCKEMTMTTTKELKTMLEHLLTQKIAKVKNAGDKHE